MSMARGGEIGALTVGDIDLITSAVDISRARTYAGRKLELGKPTSRRGVRTAYTGPVGMGSVQ
ncbi:hypothetical protein ACQP1G_00060 [Nocardia sp. CA-107356]|uniref:hypothetical protein n=1 Tax=Nocardia sp. CA-107356 TaxID=3239972 RepID=UPI003D8F8161